MAAVELDDLDKRIINALNQNARKSFRDISRELGVSLSTVSNRVRRLEDEGVIRGYIPVVDMQRIGYSLVALIGVRIAHGKLIEVQEKISKSPHVFGVYDVTGEWDSVILARFTGREELDHFVKEVLNIEHVERTFTQLVLNTMKEEHRALFEV